MGTFLDNSSIGRKLVMSITGSFLVLFLLFHVSMNLVALISPEGYNAVCEFLGANWYALVGTVILAVGVCLHFVYAFVLTFRNYKARGSIRYEMTADQKDVEWASKNMLVLGIIVILGLCLHLVNYWSKMQLVEIMGNDVNSLGYSPADGYSLIAYTFGQWYFALAYIIWFIALWFHLTHGMWSMMQSIGWANDTWYPRLKCIANIFATLIVLGFIAVVVGFFLKANCPCIGGIC